MMRKILFTAYVLFACFIEAAPPDLTPAIDTKILDDILKNHFKYHELTPLLVKRALYLYMEELDPNKTYFIKPDIEKWLDPSEESLGKILKEVEQSNFQTFMEIHSVLLKAIARHNELERKIDYNNLPKDVNENEFTKTHWVDNTDELLNRLKRIRALQIATASQLNAESKKITMELLAEKQARFDKKMSPSNPDLEKQLLVYIIKAFASSLDPHTIYFTPQEAAQFLVQVQESLKGIGAEMRQEIDGITIVKILPGGPAAKSKELKVGDKIIAVDGKPVVGMDIEDVVTLIRGPVNTPVTLTVLREEPGVNGKMHEVKLNLTLTRGEVTLTSTRYAYNYIPFGNGGLAYLRLYAFYEDPESSSGNDLKNALQKLKNEYDIKGVILDLRYNPGGLLTQAVEVAGLFIGRGVVVSIKDNKGEIIHLRHLEDTPEWGGPLIVLENRATASAAEIVTGTLQDYGRAIVVGDKHTYGKGSFQTFSLNPTKNAAINPLGELTITKGFYYTVSGRTPQLTGVHASIVVPGAISDLTIGEKYAEFPLQPNHIPPEFNDDLSDIPADKRAEVEKLYKHDLQAKMTTYEKYLPKLIQNSELRIKNNQGYQKYLKEMKDNQLEAEKIMDEEETGETPKQADYQLMETYNIMRDLLYLMLYDKEKAALK